MKLIQIISTVSSTSLINYYYYLYVYIVYIYICVYIFIGIGIPDKKPETVYRVVVGGWLLRSQR